ARFNRNSFGISHLRYLESDRRVATWPLHDPFFPRPTAHGSFRNAGRGAPGYRSQALTHRSVGEIAEQATRTGWTTHGGRSRLHLFTAWLSDFRFGFCLRFRGSRFVTGPSVAR